MVSESSGWRRDLEKAKAAVSAFAEVAGSPGACIEEAVAAVEDLRRALEGDERTAGGGLPDPNRLEVLGHLAAGVAHELNNWFFVIRGFSELARLDLPDEHPVTENFDRIEEAIDRAEGLTRMVLESAHPSGDGIVAVQLHPLVKEAVKLVRDPLSDKIRVHQAIATDAAPVTVDPVRFFPVIMTLLRIAAIPLTADGGRLWVTLAETGTEDATGDVYLVLRVGSTTGDDGDEVWRRLETGGGAPASPLPEDEGASASIGEIVRDYGGEVRCRSIDQRGRCIEVLLPVASNPAFR